MGWQLCEYAATIIEYLIYADFMVAFLDIKKGKNKFFCYAVIFSLNTILTLIFNSLVNYEGILGGIRISLNICIAIILLKGNILEKVFSAVILDITALLVSYTSLNTLGVLSGKSLEEMIETRGLIRLLNLFITKVLLFEVTRVILHIKKKKKFAFDPPEILVISLIFAITFIIGLGVFKANLAVGVPSDSPIYIIIGLGLIAINFLTYILMKRISDKNLEREKFILDKAQNEQYYSQLTEYENQFNEMRKIRHDIKNHLQCLSALISQNSNKQAENYINDIIENKLDFGHNYINTGNKVVDAIINMKLLQCKKDDITTTVHINKFDTYVEDTDFCALLSNLLDNAIEASCKETERREINIDIVPKKGYVNIIIRNAISKSVLENNPDLKTTKNDAIIHGIGMRAISDIVNKYDGMFDFFEQSNFFIVDVRLPLKRAKDAN